MFPVSQVSLFRPVCGNVPAITGSRNACRKQGLVFTAYHDTGCLHHQCLQLHGRNQRYDRSIQSDGIVHFLAAQQGNGFHRCHIDRIADDIRFGILLL